MKQCAFCQAEAKDDELFCMRCGHRLDAPKETKPAEDNLPLECPACGTRYAEGTMFCAKDGKQLTRLKANPNERVCHVCGKKYAADVPFCTECGCDLQHPPTVVGGDMEAKAKEARAKFFRELSPKLEAKLLFITEGKRSTPSFILTILACMLFFILMAIIDRMSFASLLLLLTTGPVYFAVHMMFKDTYNKQLVAPYTAYLRRFDGGVQLQTEMSKKTKRPAESKYNFINEAMVEYQRDPTNAKGK